MRRAPYFRRKDQTGKKKSKERRTTHPLLLLLLGPAGGEFEVRVEEQGLLDGEGGGQNVVLQHVAGQVLDGPAQRNAGVGMSDNQKKSANMRNKIKKGEEQE